MVSVKLGFSLWAKNKQSSQQYTVRGSAMPDFTAVFVHSSFVKSEVDEFLQPRNLLQNCVNILQTNKRAEEFSYLQSLHWSRGSYLCPSNTIGLCLYQSLAVSVWVRWAHKAILALQPYSDLLCVPISFILPVVPHLWQSTVSYIMESQHSHLVP
jgi:hypothetical protein